MKKEVGSCHHTDNCQNNDRQFQLSKGSSQSDLANGNHLTEGTSNNGKPQAFKTDTGMTIVLPNRDGVLNKTLYTYNPDGTDEPHVLVEQIQ